MLYCLKLNDLPFPVFGKNTLLSPDPSPPKKTPAEVWYLNPQKILIKLPDQTPTFLWMSTGILKEDDLSQQVCSLKNCSKPATMGEIFQATNSRLALAIHRLLGDTRWCLKEIRRMVHGDFRSDLVLRKQQKHQQQQKGQRHVFSEGTDNMIRPQRE